jgi:hypothetical protein
MSIYQCEACGYIDNTALTHYWQRSGTGLPPLCSACDPEIGKWHGAFPKESADGMLLGNDGFLYDAESEKDGRLDWRKKHQGFEIVRKIGEEA